MATFTYESIKNRFKNPTVDGNLDLLDDGGIIKVGADDDLQITHSGSAATVTNSTGDTTLDLAGDLIIDVDGADIALKDNGTQFGGFSNSSGHLQIKDGTTTFLTGNGNDATFADTLAVTGVLTADAGINIDNITIDGTEIDLSSGDLTIDVAGDLFLDAGGGTIRFKDDGTTIADISNNSSDLQIEAKVQDKDIKFLGDDGGSGITALTLDMSEAGAATFNNKVVATELDISGNADIDGTTNLDAVDIDGAVQIDNTVTVGVDDTGYDVKFFGATSGS